MHSKANPNVTTNSPATIVSIERAGDVDPRLPHPVAYALRRQTTVYETLRANGRKACLSYCTECADYCIDETLNTELAETATHADQSPTGRAHSSAADSTPPAKRWGPSSRLCPLLSAASSLCLLLSYPVLAAPTYNDHPRKLPF